ncbi:MAG: transketolase C-terminal domain-containing protein [Bacillota bacterium]|uniref:Ferredoxin oxidoreductase n=1 Tax=Thermanaerosceptrum fracticalcis TaxID=1712410 RepID=A0A7G6E5A4_THEFR|nr:transketolase C-terminal domain-containing protein [Thermanaerosceptrum fracticalcis]QNB47258.1 ferredoxin oxidoreductase [Thermanaerosceptrum fracticalcis]
MADKPVQGEKRVFMTGNEVVAWAALAAEADIMYGYPITPQNEVMHYWTRLAPKYGRKFLQTEDEISAGFTTVGGVLSGKRAFTATAGPGNTLMQESMSMAEMMRIPTVLVVQQRGGPSTATVIYSQQEVTMTCYGGNGEGLRIVYSTGSHQELYDYTIKAFNTAWKYRFPTFVLGDGYQAKMRESLYIYDPAIKGIEMVKTYPFLGSEGMPGTDRDPNHLRNTYNTEEELYEVVKELVAEYEKVAPEIVEYQEFNTDDADVLIVAHGVVTRAAQAAVKLLRSQGIKAGHFRPVTLRPFAAKELKAAADSAKKLIVVESAQGQLQKLVKDAIYGSTTPMEGYFKPGQGITAEEIVDYVKKGM